ncbi:MAG: cobaltochelatase subunit CobN, partial [Bacteroidales bacterium]|nr:cobaltochelatase subunit CobN [Bacteroidales bacterium]
TAAEFCKLVHSEGTVLGSYAEGAQEEFLKNAHPVWISKEQYEQWASEILLPDKYREVCNRYGEAPGKLLARGDSIAVASLQFGNILLFPQPRPALGEDDFKLVHGAKVPPPHSYLAPYFYMQKGFEANAIIHFGTHGNLEFTPGKSIGQSQADWSDVLIGNLPHFYYYTTGNVGEGIIAKRRTHAVLVTHLTPPFVESGMRQKYSRLHEEIHKAMDSGNNNISAGKWIKDQVVELGLHRDLQLDSISAEIYTIDELEQLDIFIMEIANEKITGAFYTMGQPYNNRDLIQTTLAVTADQLAYNTAKKDRDKGKITTEELQNSTFLSHNYLPDARIRIEHILKNPPKNIADAPKDLQDALEYREMLLKSTENEFNAMVNALNGGTVKPAPGGDPVLNPNVLPTGRNMYSINAEAAPDKRAWDDGKKLANETISQYKEKYGEYPRKVSYTFWAGEFIATQGATLAQALWMMGIEPLRNKLGYVVDLRVVPEEELGRPRINVLVQVSGQLRDIAGSRLQLITEAVKLAAEQEENLYPNYVARGSVLQEKELIEKGLTPQQAREMAHARVFGPLNNGYSTGIMSYIETSGTWDDEREIAQGYLNNMGAFYGAEKYWGIFHPALFAAAIKETDAIVQPRQSNTWGPVSLDHVYEFTGGLSLSIKDVTGKEPEAYMADYRNRTNRRLQLANQAIAVETRATILNPTFIKERMNGGEGSAQMFGKIFRNIFGWHVTRPSSMNRELYNELYQMYINDKENLGIKEYFMETNPAAFQTITSVMMESARKGYWKASDEQLSVTAAIHNEFVKKAGCACTEFVCNNEKLEQYIAAKLDANEQEAYLKAMDAVKNTQGSPNNGVVLKNNDSNEYSSRRLMVNGTITAAVAAAAMVVLVYIVKRRRREE